MEEWKDRRLKDDNPNASGFLIDKEAESPTEKYMFYRPSRTEPKAQKTGINGR